MLEEGLGVGVAKVVLRVWGTLRVTKGTVLRALPRVLFFTRT